MAVERPAEMKPQRAASPSGAVRVRPQLHRRGDPPDLHRAGHPQLIVGRQLGGIGAEMDLGMAPGGEELSATQKPPPVRGFAMGRVHGVR